MMQFEINESGGLNALIAQSDLFNRAALTHAVRSIGLNTYEAADGTGALELISSVRIDALVIDAELPDFGGLKAIRMIRTFAEVPPFLLVAREVTRALRAEAMESQAASVLRSPVDLGLFSDILTTVLSRRYGDWADGG